MEKQELGNTEEKREILARIGELSRLLGMIPSEDITVKDARDSFLKLSILVDRALNLNLS